MKFILIAAILLLVPITAHSQTVEVSQKLLDRANQAFIEVDLLRKENAALKEDGKAKDALIETLAAESDAKTVLINEKNELILRKDVLIAAQKEQIRILEDRDKVRIAEIEALRKLKCEKTIYAFGLVKTIRCR